MIYWFIGQPGSGKTTLARRLKKQFDAEGKPSVHLDGDVLRTLYGTYKAENFTKEYRIEQTRILQKLVGVLADQGINVIISTVNPYRSVREEFKASRNDVREIYVYTNDVRERDHLKSKDFEEPITNYTFISTGGKHSEEDSFIMLLSYI